ncbi:hypothetical protein BS78_02G154800 [Paspalum vaginatum]|nr:hypothetical protein BS78_02G154800 [Paspalum vaginatum]
MSLLYTNRGTGPKHIETSSTSLIPQSPPTSQTLDRAHFSDPDRRPGGGSHPTRAGAATPGPAGGSAAGLTRSSPAPTSQPRPAPTDPDSCVAPSPTDPDSCCPGPRLARCSAPDPEVWTRELLLAPRPASSSSTATLPAAAPEAPTCPATCSSPASSRPALDPRPPPASRPASSGSTPTLPAAATDPESRAAPPPTPTSQAAPPRLPLSARVSSSTVEAKW